MKLIFHTNGGFRFEIDVSSDDTLQEIKGKIRTNHGFAISSQTLFFDDVIISTDAELLAARRRLIEGSEIRLHEVPTSERPLPAIPDQPSTSNFIRAESDAVSMSELDARLIDGSEVRLDEAPTSERPLPAIPDQPSTSCTRAESDAISMPETLDAVNHEHQEAAAEAQVQVNDVTITVTVKHDKATTSVEILPGQLVAHLREMVDFPLPARYGFLHGTWLLNERLSFAEQNVGDGDELLIVY